jgi:hypothetical protein
MEDGVNFDKFMDSILVKEAQAERRDAGDEELPPMQRLAKQRREKPAQLVRFTPQGNK